MLPNFMIAGGVATGTSFLSATLAQHPEVYLPRIQRPEPNFFHYSWKFDKGLDWYLNTWFHEVDGQRAIGERSSLLLNSDVAAARIRQFVPQMKLIFCLRNPMERAWANYRFTVLEGLEQLSFEQAIENEQRRMGQASGIWAEVQPHAYLTRSRYADQLRQFEELFGRDNILLIKSEDLGRNPHEHVKRVCEFLNVDSSIQLPLPPNYSSPSVTDRFLQMQLRSYFGNRFPEIVECIRREEDVAAFVNNEEDLINVLRLKDNLRVGKDPLPEHLRLRMREIFSSEIASVKKLVDFEINDWV